MRSKKARRIEPSARFKVIPTYRQESSVDPLALHDMTGLSRERYLYIEKPVFFRTAHLKSFQMRFLLD